MSPRIAVLLLGLGAMAAPRADAQEPVTVAIRPLAPATSDSAAAIAVREALLEALKTDSRVEVENTGQYVVIGSVAPAGGAARVDLRIASVATGTMTPLSFVFPDGDRAAAVANAARALVEKVLELAGRR